MKPKGQQQFTSEIDAKEKLIVYVYEYLIHSGAKQAADIFKENIGYAKDIKVNDGPGFLLDWWCVFWDLYCAAPERRHSTPESSNDARAFHDYMRTQQPMSPSIAQTSPPQFMGGSRYGPPGGPIRGPPPRMPQPHPSGPSGFMSTGSPRYAQGLPPPQPIGGPPPQPISAGPPPQPISGGPPPQSISGGPPPQVNTLQGPPRSGSQGNAAGWQNNVNYNVSSPANQPCYQGHPQDEYVMPVQFSQETNEHCESAEILKLKQSMQEDTTKMFEKEQSEFSLGDYSETQNIM